MSFTIISTRPDVKKYIYITVSFILLTLSIIRIALFPNASLIFYGTDWLQALNIMPYFLIGGTAKLLSNKKFFNVQISAVLLIIFSWISFEIQWLNELICLSILSYFVLALSLTDEQKLHFRWIKCEYAYGIYLYGFIEQQCIISKLYTSSTFPNKWIAFTISVILTYILAALSFKFIYTPFIKLCYLHNVYNKDARIPK